MDTTENLGTAAAAVESAGQGGTVDAQNTESPNTAAAVGAGQSEVAGGQAQADTSAAAKPAQNREENAAFARMRRELEQARSDLERYQTMSRVVGEVTGADGNDPDLLRRELLARRDGVTADEIRRREEQDALRYKEQLQRDPQYIAAQNELLFYRQQAANAQRQQDIAELKAKYPADRIDEASLGEQYVRLRSAGVDNLTAYAALRAVKDMAEGEKQQPPPDTGAVGKASEQQPDFYTPEQVDQLTPKQLDDPKIMEKVMKSMTKWKK